MIGFREFLLIFVQEATEWPKTIVRMAKNNSQNLYEFIVVYTVLGMDQADAIVREFGYPG